MATSIQITSVAFLLLIASSLAGNVSYSGGTTSISGNMTKHTLASSYGLSDGNTWTRDRTTEETGPFPEFYSLSGQSGCKIACAPYSHPVISSGALFCQRDLSFFSTVVQPWTYASFKSLCVPSFPSIGSCSSSSIYDLDADLPLGDCDYDSVTYNYHYASATFDCCHNNENYAESRTVNAYSDKGATIQ